MASSNVKYLYSKMAKTCEQQDGLHGLSKLLLCLPVRTCALWVNIHSQAQGEISVFLCWLSLFAQGSIPYKPMHNYLLLHSCWWKKKSIENVFHTVVLHAVAFYHWFSFVIDTGISLMCWRFGVWQLHTLVLCQHTQLDFVCIKCWSCASSDIICH